MKVKKASTRAAANKKPRTSICWALDPFHDDIKFHSHALAVLLPFARALDAAIAPISYIDSGRSFENSGNRFPLLPLVRDSIESLKTIAEKRLQPIERGPAAKFLEKTTFLSDGGRGIPSLKDKVSAISKEAKRRKALFIALHSHSRRGLQRLYMGSFAETFLLAGDIPTLIVNPTSKPPTSIRHILFPTDFSKESLITFELARKLAEALRCKLFIVNCLRIAELAEFLRQPARRQYEAEVAAEAKSLKIKGEALVAKCRKHGVDASFELIIQREIAAQSEVLLRNAASKKIDLIVLAAKSGSVKAALMGATSREIARNANCPVLISRAAS